MKRLIVMLLLLVMVAPTVVFGQQIPVIHTDTTRETQPELFVNDLPQSRLGSRPSVIIHGDHVFIYYDNDNQRSLRDNLGLLGRINSNHAGAVRIMLGDGTLRYLPGVKIHGDRFHNYYVCLDALSQIIGATVEVNRVMNTVKIWTSDGTPPDARRPVRISEPTFFSQEELRELIRYAYPAEWTMPSRPHPNRRMNQQELEEWIEEFWVLGINREELQMLYYTNAARMRYGSRPAKLCPYQSMAARLMAQLSLEGHRTNIAHRDTIYGSPRDRIRFFDPTMCTTENAAGSPNPYHAVGGLLNSPGHRWNLLARYSDNPCFGHGNLGGAIFQKMVSCP